MSYQTDTLEFVNFLEAKGIDFSEYKIDITLAKSAVHATAEFAAKSCYAGVKDLPVKTIHFAELKDHKRMCSDCSLKIEINGVKLSDLLRVSEYLVTLRRSLNNIKTLKSFIDLKSTMYVINDGNWSFLQQCLKGKFEGPLKKEIKQLLKEKSLTLEELKNEILTDKLFETHAVQSLVPLNPFKILESEEISSIRAKEKAFREKIIFSEEKAIISIKGIPRHSKSWLIMASQFLYQKLSEDLIIVPSLVAEFLLEENACSEAVIWPEIEDSSEKEILETLQVLYDSKISLKEALERAHNLSV